MAGKGLDDGGGCEKSTCRGKVAPVELSATTAPWLFPYGLPMGRLTDACKDKPQAPDCEEQAL
ncbi:hypothetical protein GCM10009083_12890 [Halopseudomonas pertucinogena]|uniref:Uncharacterized protein n=1 Tax=Halopseudomonas pertucinogena TaxID=86175 RepID=A0ABQ2CSC5_9GAMM|nr:hypothetical protein GCM10009083_12890 [Halopseudomonas pertucinogena]